MKLRNKKTGEIWDIGKVLTNDYPAYESLKQINEEWEDYEEPKWLRDYWFIDTCGNVVKQEDDGLGATRREIGNYFETKEEAEKAVEKLKALKRLKDKGFKISFVQDGGCVYLRADWGILLGDFSDVELLFGGGE